MTTGAVRDRRASIRERAREERGRIDSNYFVPRNSTMTTTLLPEHTDTCVPFCNCGRLSATPRAGLPATLRRVSTRARARARTLASTVARAAYASRRRRRRRRRKAVPISKVIVSGHANDCDMDTSSDEDGGAGNAGGIKSRQEIGGGGGKEPRRLQEGERERESYCTDKLTIRLAGDRLAAMLFPNKLEFKLASVNLPRER